VLSSRQVKRLRPLGVDIFTSGRAIRFASESSNQDSGDGSKSPLAAAPDGFEGSSALETYLDRGIPETTETTEALESDTNTYPGVYALW